MKRLRSHCARATQELRLPAMGRFRPLSVTFTLAVLSAIGSGCSSTSSSSTQVERCTPGEAVTCRTPSGCAGEKVCRADGNGFEACLCADGGGGNAGSGGEGATGGAPGSGGSGGSSTGGSSTGGSSTGGSGAGGASDAGACDLVAQNCPGGARCLDSGAGPRCIPMTDAARQVNESCSRSNDGDDCDRGLVCLDGDATGICRRYCADETHCDQDFDCVEVDQGGQACHRQCVPDVLDCQAEQACYVAAAEPLLMFCYAAGTLNQSSPCDQRNDCMPGNACATVPPGTECGGGQAGQCCAGFCRDSGQCSAGETCIRFDNSAPYGFCWTQL
jgi:hypothetical protein